MVKSFGILKLYTDIRPFTSVLSQLIVHPRTVDNKVVFHVVWPIYLLQVFDSTIIVMILVMSLISIIVYVMVMVLTVKRYELTVSTKKACFCSTSTT